MNLIIKRRAIAGSAIGGISETQEMLDFCAEHDIVADIELIRIDEVDDAYDRMLKGDVKYRFVRGKNCDEKTHPQSRGISKNMDRNGKVPPSLSTIRWEQ